MVKGGARVVFYHPRRSCVFSALYGHQMWPKCFLCLSNTINIVDYTHHIFLVRRKLCIFVLKQNYIRSDTIHIFNLRQRHFTILTSNLYILHYIKLPMNRTLALFHMSSPHIGVLGAQNTWFFGRWSKAPHDLLHLLFQTHIFFLLVLFLATSYFRSSLIHDVHVPALPSTLSR
jgi:hypothetical protein